MAEVDYAVLQQHHGGRYVARRGSEIVASAESYDELSEQLEDEAEDWDDLVVEYIEPTNVIRVY